MGLKIINHKKVAIIQSNYIPWKGYFDFIASVDEFILFDDVQFTRRDWRNRNIIKTPQGPKWLTIPVLSKGNYNQRINEVITENNDWTSVHWKTIDLNYKRAKYYDEISQLLEPLYSTRENFLSEINFNFISAICNYLKIKTKISRSSDYKIHEGKTNRLANLCYQTGACEYVSGPAAKAYLEENLFADANIKVTFFDYTNYPEYPQLWSNFIHNVSIIDLLFNCGPNSRNYMKYINE